MPSDKKSSSDYKKSSSDDKEKKSKRTKGSSSVTDSQCIPPTDTMRLNDDIRKLKDYLLKLEYCPKEPIRFSERTERLAQPTLKCLRGTFENFRTTLPKFKREMLKEDLDKFDTKNITTEQLKDYMERRAEAERERIQARRNRFQEFQKTLSIIEAQCRESVMKDIVQKFAEYVAARTVKCDFPKLLTEPQQRICRGLVCNMLMSLGISSNRCKRVDTALFEAISNVLADIMMKTLYQIQIVDPDEFELPDEVPEIKCTQIECISKRAKRAVRKNAQKQEAKITDELNKFKPGKYDIDPLFKLVLDSEKCPLQHQKYHPPTD